MPQPEGPTDAMLIAECRELAATLANEKGFTLELARLSRALNMAAARLEYFNAPPDPDNTDEADADAWDSI